MKTERYLALQAASDLKKKMVFVVVEGLRRPILAVECKSGDDEPGKGLRYFRSLHPACPAWQVSAADKRDYETPEGIRVAPALKLLSSLI